MFKSIRRNLVLFVTKHSQNSEICEISGPKYTLFEKTNPILCVFQPKNHDLPKTKPIQTQFKPNYLALFNYKNSVQSASKINAFYAKRTHTSSLSAQKPQFHQKTNPKRAQTKPNRKTAKMNLYPLLTERYEKIR